MSIFSKDSSKGKAYINGKYGIDVQPVVSNNTLEYLYSIYDKVCGEYNPPFVCKNLPTAIRNMRDSLKDAKQSIIAMHPEDYVLVQIGTFDKETGVVSNLDDVHRLTYHLSLLFEPEKPLGEVKDAEIQNK